VCEPLRHIGLSPRCPVTRASGKPAPASQRWETLELLAMWACVFSGSRRPLSDRVGSAMAMSMPEHRLHRCHPRSGPLVGALSRGAFDHQPIAHVRFHCRTPFLTCSLACNFVLLTMMVSTPGRTGVDRASRRDRAAHTDHQGLVEWCAADPIDLDGVPRGFAARRPFRLHLYRASS
jgi:hypothetical protein